MSRQTIQAKNNINNYNRSTSTRLSDVYKTSCSYKKQTAYNYCKDLCKKHNGRDLKIISHNTYVFTAGFIFTDTDTGVIKFMYITPSNNTIVDY